jgi:hypothetical protein
MKLKHPSIYILNIFLLFACNINDIDPKKQNDNKPTISNEINTKIDIEIYRQQAVLAKQFIKENKLNSDFYFLIDLNRHSGLKRFFIWDFNKDTIENSFLVSHGCGQNPWGREYSKEKAEISNKDGSHASSVGKYIIKERGFSNWGIHVKYNLKGQDSSNSNAFKRLIVLHSWERVPDEEVFPKGTPEGWGCPAVSNTSMQIIDKKLKSSKKYVLLWVIQ